MSTGRVWVSSESGVLRRMDPTAGRVELSVPACDDTDYVVAAVGSIWRRATAAATSSGSIPTRLRGSPRCRVGTRGQGIAVDRGAAWVANDDTARLLRIDLATNRVTAGYRTGFGPTRRARGARKRLGDERERLDGLPLHLPLARVGRRAAMITCRARECRWTEDGATGRAPADGHMLRHGRRDRQ